MATIKLLASFDGTDGRNPDTNLVADTQGDLFGVAPGGANNDGVVFEVANTTSGYASTPDALFVGSSGTVVNALGLFVDAAGNLFGTNQNDGTDSDGSVYEIANTSSGYAAFPTTLSSFNGTDGSTPTGSLITDPAGDLFGTTLFNGANGNGTVFEVRFTNGAYSSTPTALVSLNDNGGFGFPNASLITDAAGDLFGTTHNFGDVGSVFEVPFSNGSYASTATTLATFSTGGSLPLAGLVMDSAGDLFGVTQSGNGEVFEIANTSSGYASTPTVLFTGNTTLGGFNGGLVIDAAGDLFGTIAEDGNDPDGAVFEIPFNRGSYAATPTILASFDGSAGEFPDAGLIADSSGNLFGTAFQGGANSDGTVFEVTGAGFVTCYRRGTRIATPDGEREVEVLTAGDLVLNAAGKSRPIVWIGYRQIDCRRMPAPGKVWPVLVRAGAFGEGMPHRDLFLSPDHAVFADGVLIPIRHLINRVTIAQVPADEVIYYHVELAEHDLLMAEGLPAESYLDTGDRFAFDNGGAVAPRPVDVALCWETAGCAPLIVTGTDLHEVRRRVNAIAGCPHACRDLFDPRPRANLGPWMNLPI
jgi:uncharacterized repeat protein (TIGR03803 family)